MFFYSVVYEGGTRLLKCGPSNKWLSFATEQPIDLSQKQYSPAGYFLKQFSRESFREGGIYNIALGSPPVIVEGVVLIGKGERRLFSNWLKQRLQNKEFQGEEWWILKSQTTGLLFVRINQKSFLDRHIATICLAMPIEKG